MVKITCIEHAGSEHVVEVSLGISLMEAAVKNSIPGIDADCGGSCACATCHVVVDPAWFEKTGKLSVYEEEMLDFVPVRESTSRLSCQIEITPELDGLVIRIPESQR